MPTGPDTAGQYAEIRLRELARSKDVLHAVYEAAPNGTPRIALRSNSDRAEDPSLVAIAERHIRQLYTPAERAKIGEHQNTLFLRARAACEPTPDRLHFTLAYFADFSQRPDHPYADRRVGTLAYLCSIPLGKKPLAENPDIPLFQEMPQRLIRLYAMKFPHDENTPASAPEPGKLTIDARAQPLLILPGQVTRSKAEPSRTASGRLAFAYSETTGEGITQELPHAHAISTLGALIDEARRKPAMLEQHPLFAQLIPFWDRYKTTHEISQDQSGNDDLSLLKRAAQEYGHLEALTELPLAVQELEKTFTKLRDRQRHVKTLEEQTRELAELRRKLAEKEHASTTQAEREFYGTIQVKLGIAEHAKLLPKYLSGELPCDKAPPEIQEAVKAAQGYLAALAQYLGGKGAPADIPPALQPAYTAAKKAIHSRKPALNLAPLVHYAATGTEPAELDKTLEPLHAAIRHLFQDKKKADAEARAAREDSERAKAALKRREEALAGEKDERKRTTASLEQRLARLTEDLNSARKDAEQKRAALEKKNKEYTALERTHGQLKEAFDHALSRYDELDLQVREALGEEQ
ncbi:hypothetical protein C4580_05900 [Candidatus Woesearchaeota archaeon]|nr:MAG: hypothetical protein C4580_05900 [Candidatus Woesearchaeota archaeon]